MLASANHISNFTFKNHMTLFKVCSSEPVCCNSFYVFSWVMRHMNILTIAQSFLKNGPSRKPHRKDNNLTRRLEIKHTHI